MLYVGILQVPGTCVSICSALEVKITNHPTFTISWSQLCLVFRAKISKNCRQKNWTDRDWPSKHLSESNRMYNTREFINLQYHSTKTKKAPHAKSSMFILCSSPYVGERLQSQNGAFSNVHYLAATASTCLPGCHCIDPPENIRKLNGTSDWATSPCGNHQASSHSSPQQGDGMLPKVCWPLTNHEGTSRFFAATNGPSMSHVALLQTHLLGQRANQITVGNHYLPQNSKLTITCNMLTTTISPMHHLAMSPKKKMTKNLQGIFPQFNSSSVFSQKLRGSARSSARAKQPACWWATPHGRRTTLRPPPSGENHAATGGWV